MIDIKAIQDRINDCPDKNAAHWGYEEGVLMTANEAQELIDLYKRVYGLGQEEKVSTLGGGIISGRRKGNSTRQIDRAIQIIFSGRTCVVLDHFEDGSSHRANLYLFNQILSRLAFEHEIGVDKLNIDRNKLEISLKKYNLNED